MAEGAVLVVARLLARKRHPLSGEVYDRLPDNEQRAFDGEAREYVAAVEETLRGGEQVQMGGEPPVTQPDPVVVLFYVLLRDHVSPGEMEHVMLGLEEIGTEEPGWKLSNAYLAGYGANLAKRLRELDC